MHRPTLSLAFSMLATVASLVVFVRPLAAASVAQATHGIVASAHPLATDAGVQVLKQGGNAIDAAVAVALTLGVVDADNSGLGGGCLMLIRLANGALVAIDGRETAPAAATPELFRRAGKAETALSQTGPLASGVPGALAVYELAVDRYGRKRLADLLLPAADLAEHGFKLDASYARSLKRVAADMVRFDSSRAVFFKHDRPLTKGELLKQPDLAATYRSIAGQGSAWFYRGPFAHLVDQWMKEHGGVLDAQDFRAYQPQLREPILSTYRGYQLVGFPPPTSGGVHVAQLLNLLEHFDLKAFDDVTRIHILAEAMKLAFADRAYWLGDPDFVRVPRGLTGKEYGAALAARIDPARVVKVPFHGTPADWQTNVFPQHTTHFSVADEAGNWVACTATLNTSFGSKVVVPGTGVVLNNQMDDFSLQPGVTNYFGLLDAAGANTVAPRKRPLSSMSPTLVLKDGQPILALGAAGGPTIISQVVLELVGLLDFGMTPAQAIASPRFHHQWFPDELVVEKKLPRAMRWGLAARGHVLKETPSLGVSQIVARAPDGQGFVGVADPRAGGKAAGW